jgi:FdrA protein
VRHVELRRGTYRDSVRLMEVSRAVAGTPGVASALVAMATELNAGMATDLGFPVPAEATANDLLVAVEAPSGEVLEAALDTLRAELDRRATAEASGPTTTPPRTVGSAVRRTGGTLALISTPGRYAAADAADALLAGANVVLFSDNVPVEAEIALKDLATERGLLLMGPDCGTAVVGGVGLGFANVVRPGPVGLVSASGTGAQQVMSLLDAAGVGISHCLGVGGRDLSASVGGRSTRAALAALDADPATELILLISKPPAPGVAEDIRAYASRLRTPVVYALLGVGGPDLTAATEQVLAALGEPVPDWPAWPHEPAAPRTGALRGLFSGGTLCDEAMLIAAATLGPIRSNIPLDPQWTLGPDLDAYGAHAMIDFGDDALTAGRPHPMIDSTLRLRRLAAEAADPGCAAILLDVVLGHAAHPDPSAELAGAIAAVDTPVVVSLTGTDGDPQDLIKQISVLQRAGAAVFRSNAAAARYAAGLVT